MIVSSYQLKKQLFMITFDRYEIKTVGPLWYIPQPVLRVQVVGERVKLYTGKTGEGGERKNACKHS